LNDAAAFFHLALVYAPIIGASLVCAAPLGLLRLLRGTLCLFFGLSLGSLSRLFARLSSGGGEVPILGTMQIRPRIQRRHILRRLVRVGYPFPIRHPSPLTLPRHKQKTAILPVLYDRRLRLPARSGTTGNPMSSTDAGTIPLEPTKPYHFSGIKMERSDRQQMVLSEELN
jgi:hypothetical protein